MQNPTLPSRPGSWLTVAFVLLLLLGHSAAQAFTITTGTVPNGPNFCAGAAMRVPYTVDQPFTSGNVFTAQLSDSNGSFAAPVSIGTLAGTSSGTVQAVVPAATATGSGYRVRVVGSIPLTTGSDNGLDLTITNIGTLTASANASLCVGDNLLLTASFVAGASYSWTGPAGFSSLLRNPTIANVGLNRSGTYTVTAAANGCSTTATLAVVVNALPVAAIAPNTPVICSGSSVQLVATGGTSYAWSPSTGLSSSTIANPVASPTASTIYTVTATNAAGCASTSQVTVTVRATPAVSINPSAPSICAGTSVTLGATGAQSYQWSPTTGLNNPNSANPVASPTQTTTYTVTGNSNGCTSTSTVTVTVETPPTASAGPAQVLCSGQSTTLGTTAVAGLTYSWSPTTGLSAANVAQPTITLTNTTNNARTTTYTLTVVSAGGCVSSSATQVTVNPAATATAGPALTLCPSQTGQLGATAAAGTTYSWSPTTGLSSATIANPTVTLPNATSAPIVSTYTLTASRNGCQATGTVAVTVNPAQNAAFSYGATVLCTAAGNPTPTLAGSSAGTFTATPAGLVFVSTTTGQIDVTASTSGTYTITFTTNGPCPDTRSATVTLTSTPSASFQYPNPTYCLGGGTATPALASGALGGTYTSTAGLVLDPATGIINLTTSAAGTYTITNTVGNGSSCAATATTTVALTAGANIAVTTSQTTLCAGQSATLTATGGLTYAYTGGGQTLTGASVTVSPTQTTTYTVTGTTVGGCTSTAQITLTVNPVPVITAGANVAAVCAGQSATLSASGASSYTWTGGGQTLTGPLVTVTPTQTTTYTVTGTNGNPCIATAQVTVTVNALPTVALNLPSTTVCVTSGPLTLSGGTPAGGTYSGVGVSSGIFTPATTGPGTYTLTYTATSAAGCTATTTQQLIVTTCLATTAVAPLASLAVFPNPTTGRFTLALSGSTHAAAADVFNVLGQAIYSVRLPAAGSSTLNQDVDLSTQPSGVYLLRLDLGNGQQITRRLVLNH